MHFGSSTKGLALRLRTVLLGLHDFMFTHNCSINATQWVWVEKITYLMVEVSHLVLCKLAHGNITFTGLVFSSVFPD